MVDLVVVSALSERTSLYYYYPFTESFRWLPTRKRARFIIICVSMIDSVCPRTYSSGDPIKNLVVGARAHRVPRGSKLFWLFYLVGVDCFGYVYYSTSSELTISPRRVTRTKLVNTIRPRVKFSSFKLSRDSSPVTCYPNLRIRNSGAQ